MKAEISPKAHKRASRMLHNIYDRSTLEKILEAEDFARKTLSFYRYVKIDNPEFFRDKLYREWFSLRVLGRVYIAHEGINAQVSVPEHNYSKFLESLESRTELRGMRINRAVQDDKKSFLKLKLKVRPKLVNDGLQDDSYDVTNVGTHLSPEEFNSAMELPETIVVDMRNHYESEVGHFENAVLPEADTFREELPQVLDLLKGKENQKVLLYCTGGIRCEKASAFLRHHGFNDVNQLYGGIIYYAHDIQQKRLKTRFKGKNFVFDERLGEKISEEVISHCHQCENLSDNHVNCANNQCHLLFIQCDSCKQRYQGCCSEECMKYNSLSEEEKLANPFKKSGFHHSRLRPVLQQRSGS